MKILVLSDSHASYSFMRLCIQKVKPQHVIHLGDFYEDAQVMQGENPHIRFHIVPGNCDKFRCDPNCPEIMCYSIEGVRIYMTHGHRHNVKTSLFSLLFQARKENAQCVLFGHTHSPVCERQEDGMWVINPGSCGSYGGSACEIIIDDGKISACRILRQADVV